jgi:hypothetical protein
MRFMRISTPLRPTIAETNQFLRFLRLINLALNEIKSSNSECSAWVSIRRLTRLRYAARDHIFKLQIYYKNYTVTQQITDARPAVQSTTTVLVLDTKKAGHPCHRATNVFITAYADIEKMGRLTPKASGTCNYVISSLCISSVTFQLTHTRSRLTPAYCSTRPSNPVPVYHSLISKYLFTLFNSSVSTSVYISGVIAF